MPQQPAKPAKTYQQLVHEWRGLAGTHRAAYQSTRRAYYNRSGAAYEFCAFELERAMQAADDLASLGEDGDELARYFEEFVAP